MPGNYQNGMQGKIMKIKSSTFAALSIMLLIFVAIPAAFTVGYRYRIVLDYKTALAGYTASPDCDFTSLDAIKFMESAKYTHQYYVDHPDIINSTTGSAEDNARWVAIYDAVIKVLEK